MSYTYKVKNEILSKNNLSLEEKYVEVRSILLGKNSISEDKIELKLENKELAERVYDLLKDITDLKIIVKYSISKKLGEHNVYIISIQKQRGFKNFLEELNGYTREYIEGKHNLEASFIRGLFLACGYIKPPEKEYALDFFIDSDEIADELYELLKEQGKKVFLTRKRNRPLVYIRNSEDIMDIIVLIGCLKQFYSYEETTMIKDLKNKTIREMNWEVANETKTLNTGVKQIRMINYIGKKLGLNTLSPVLEEVAFLRLQNPESSLVELGELIGISKSGVRNRFRRIEEIYNELIEKERE